MGKWLKEQQLAPDYVVSSPAQRARLTILAVAQEAGIHKSQIHWDDRVYAADASSPLQVLSDCPKSAQRVMMVIWDGWWAVLDLNQ